MAQKPGVFDILIDDGNVYDMLKSDFEIQPGQFRNLPVRLGPDGPEVGRVLESHQLEDGDWESTIAIDMASGDIIPVQVLPVSDACTSKFCKDNAETPPEDRPFPKKPKTDTMSMFEAFFKYLQ